VAEKTPAAALNSDEAIAQSGNIHGDSVFTDVTGIPRGYLKPNVDRPLRTAPVNQPHGGVRDCIEWQAERDNYEFDE
jgi:hypothetical protein